MISSKNVSKKITKKNDRFTKMKQPKKDNYNYWTADLVKGNVIVGKGISEREANLRVSINKNIMCRNQNYALNIAKNFKPYFLEIDKNQLPGKAYYLHYHVKGKHGSPHIWLYGM